LESEGALVLVNAGPYEILARRISAGEIVILDGGTGTTIEQRGVPMDAAAWSALANLDQRDVVSRVHQDFIEAGADVVVVNTFSAAGPALAAAGFSDRVADANRLGVRAAQEARAAFPDRSIAIAGSLSSYPASSRLPERLPQFVSPGPDELRAAYDEQLAAQIAEGIDLIALEMINSPTYGSVAVEAAQSTGLPIWLGVSPIDNGDGRILVVDDGPEDEVQLDELLSALIGPELSVVGLMHCKAEIIEPALEVLARHWQGPVMVYPEVGTWRPPNWLPGELTPDEYLALAERWVAAGAQLIGGCCGVGPDHIAALRPLGHTSEHCSRHDPGSRHEYH
jgi:S-methylmethionine-dependent homocysteine/selenocysteine methylase